MPDPSEGEQQASVAPPGDEPAEAVAGGAASRPRPSPRHRSTPTTPAAAHLGRLLRSPVTLSLGAALVIACFVGGTLAVGALLGLGAAAVGALLVFLIVFVIASAPRRRTSSAPTRPPAG